MLFTLKEIAQLFKVQPATLLRLAELGEFPRPIRLSRRLFRWRKSDIENHIAFLAGDSETTKTTAQISDLTP